MSYYSMDDHKIAATQRDGINRLGRYRDDDGNISIHVIQLVDDGIKTTLLSDWVGPTPADPTQADIDLAVDERETQRANRIAKAEMKQQQVIDLAQTTVGLKLKDLSLLQLKSILAILFDERGIIDETMTIQPLKEWITRRRVL